MRPFIQSFLIPLSCAALANSASANVVGATNLNAVPDGGMTAIFLGGALAVLAVLRRFVKR